MKKECCGDNLEERRDEILGKGFILGLKLSAIYLAIFVIVILLAPDEIATKFAIISIVSGFCIIFGVILHGTITKIRKRK